MLIVVDNINSVADEAKSREVGQSPDPAKGPAQLARLGLVLGSLWSLCRVSSAESEAARGSDRRGGSRADSISESRRSGARG